MNSLSKPEQRQLKMCEALSGHAVHQPFTISEILADADLPQKIPAIRATLSGILNAGKAAGYFEETGGTTSNSEKFWIRIATLSPDQILSCYQEERKIAQRRYKEAKIAKKSVVDEVLDKKPASAFTPSKKEYKPSLSSIEGDLSAIQGLLDDVVRDLRAIRESLS